jgi:hypothetical protein
VSDPNLSLATKNASAEASDPAAATEASVRSLVEQTLRDLPESRLEARRTVTRELEFDPTPEELQAIDRLARESIPGPAGEMSLGALVLRVRAERRVSHVLDAPLDGPTITGAARTMAELLHEVGVFSAALQAATGALDKDAARFLREVGETLLPSAELVITASVLAPRLSLFRETAAEGELRAAVPALSDSEAARIAATLRGATGSSDDTSRAALNALALRTIIEDDLAAWAAIRDGSGLESGESIGRRLQQDKIAYLVLAAQLQKRQDLALVAGLQSLAGELRAAKRDLFATYTRLAAVLNGGTDPGDGASASEEHGSGAEIERLLDECRAADAIAEAQRSVRQTTEELFLDALKTKNAPGSTQRRVRRSLGELQRDRRRMRLLLTVAGVLLLGCVAYYGVRFGRIRRRVRARRSADRHPCPPGRIDDVRGDQPVRVGRAGARRPDDLRRAARRRGPR